MTSDMTSGMSQARRSLAHWGGFSADIDNGDITSVTPLDGDTDPSPLLGNTRLRRSPRRRRRCGHMTHR